MKHVILYLTLFCMGSLVLQGQDLTRDVVKINNAYKQISKVSMNTRYTLYRNHEGKEVVSMEEGFVKSDSVCQYTKIGPVETLSTPQLFVMINHSDKLIIVDRPDKVKENNPVDLAFDIEKTVKKGTDVKYTRLSSSMASYSFDVQDGEFQKMNIRFGLKDYLIYQMDLYYRRSQDLENSPAKSGKPLLVIEYFDINKKPRFNKGTFAIEQFVYKLGKTYKPSLNYKDYAIIDQTVY